MQVKNTFIDISGPKAATIPTPLASAPAKCAFSLKDSLALAAAAVEDEPKVLDGSPERRARLKPEPLKYVPAVNQMEPIPEAKLLFTPAAFPASIPPTPAAVSSIPPTPAALYSMEILATPTGTPAERARTTLSLSDMIQPPLVASSCSQPVYQQPGFAGSAMSTAPVQLLPPPTEPVTSAAPALAPAPIVAMAPSAPPTQAPIARTQLLPPSQPPPPQYTPKTTSIPTLMVPHAPPACAPTEARAPLSYNAPPAPSAAVQLGLVPSAPAVAPSRVVEATLPTYQQAFAAPIVVHAAPVPTPAPAYQYTYSGSPAVETAWSTSVPAPSMGTVSTSWSTQPPPPPTMAAPTFLLSPKKSPAPLMSPCAAPKVAAA
mmetsp:Transcript_25085/g.46040  ORF Transcript_25085/g.46040 Transcript_25085/m.46040 type:complete len:374 (-) Transcript_25085:75-1196(-)